MIHVVSLPSAPPMTGILAWSMYWARAESVLPVAFPTNAITWSFCTMAWACETALAGSEFVSSVKSWTGCPETPPCALTQLAHASIPSLPNCSPLSAAMLLPQSHKKPSRSGVPVAAAVAAAAGDVADPVLAEDPPGDPLPELHAASARPSTTSTDDIATNQPR